MGTKNKHTQSMGFTIVELLIVVVVIAILAAITIVAYNGISTRATESSMRSDLRNAINVLEADKASTNNYPTSASAANNGQGLRSSASSTLSYEPKAYGFCVGITSTKTSKTFTYKSNTGQVAEGGECVSLASTFAGTGATGYVDGNGASAQFNAPRGVAADSAGNVYVGDYNNHRIRKITPTGTVSTFVGNGTAGNVNGTGTGAQVSYPQYMTTDAAGNVYVIVSYSGMWLRKITPAGVTSTLGEVYGSSPEGITVTPNGNIYVSTYGNGIRVFNPSGALTNSIAPGGTGFADGNASSALFNYPKGLGSDSAGNVYVADFNNHRIRKITPDGTVSTFAGNGTRGSTNGTGTAATFDYPTHIAVAPDGTVYVTQNSNLIRKITPEGVVSNLNSGEYGDANGPISTAQFTNPAGLTVDPSGNLFVADVSNHKVRKVTP